MYFIIEGVNQIQPIAFLSFNHHTQIVATVSNSTQIRIEYSKIYTLKVVLTPLINPKESLISLK